MSPALRASSSAAVAQSGRLRLTSLVARREYLRTVRRRGFMFATILLPLGIGFLMTISMFFSTDGFAPDGVARGTMIITDPAARTREREFTILRKDLEDGGRQNYYV